MKPKQTDLKDYINNNRRKVQRENLNAKQGFTFEDDKLLAIRRKIESSGVVLGEICKAFCGTSKTGFRDYVKEIDKREVGDVDFLESREIGKYSAEVKKVVDPVIYSDNVINILSGKNNINYIFVTRMTSSLRSFIPKKGTYCGKVNCVYPKEKYDMDLIVALINTEIVTKYVYIISSLMHDGFISGDIPTLLKIIVPKGISQLQGYTSKIQQLKKQGKPTDHLESEVEKIVQELYGLTDEEVEYLCK